jgi:hypothetical protein
MPELNEWDSFYVIVGSAAGALLGLQFVVMTLISERPPSNAADAGAAFATPTIVHFSVVLFLSAIIRAPWHSMASIGALFAVVAVGGIAYTAVVVRRMRLQTAYKPCLEDWLFHAVFPLAAYLLFGASALLAHSHSREAMFGSGASVLGLLFIGIHNAWDAVIYQVFASDRTKGKEDH